MEGFELSIMIKRPIEDAFAVLANLENDVKWHSAFVEARNTSGGSLSVGARFLVFEGLLGRRTGGTVYEVTEYEPNQVAAWKTVSSPLALTFKRTFEGVDGGTRFTVRYDTQARGFFKLMLSMMVGLIKRQHAGDLRKVKELLETRAL